MKRFTSVVISLLLLFSVCLMTGCTAVSAGKGTEPKAYFISGSDGAEAKTSSEYALWSFEKQNPHEDRSAPAEKTVSFNGKTYQGSYQRSCVRVPYTFVSHRYEADGVYFEINAETGEMTYILLGQAFDKTADKTEAECRTIADGIAAAYLPLNEYETEVTVDPYEGSALYTYTYSRKVDGFETSDSMFVSVFGNGNVSSIRIEDIGAFKGVSSVGIDAEKADKAALEKASSVIAPKEGSFSVINRRLVKTEDGGNALLYIVEATFSEPDGIYGHL